MDIQRNGQHLTRDIDEDEQKKKAQKTKTMSKMDPTKEKNKNKNNNNIKPGRTQVNVKSKRTPPCVS